MPAGARQHSLSKAGNYLDQEGRVLGFLALTFI